MKARQIIEMLGHEEEDVASYPTLSELPSSFPDVNVQLADGAVAANIGGAKGGRCRILSFWSLDGGGQGRGTQALRELRSVFREIVVDDPLAEDFWEKMRERGLIDGYV